MDPYKEKRSIVLSRQYNNLIGYDFRHLPFLSCMTIKRFVLKIKRIYGPYKLITEARGIHFGIASKSDGMILNIVCDYIIKNNAESGYVVLNVDNVIKLMGLDSAEESLDYVENSISRLFSTSLSFIKIRGRRSSETHTSFISSYYFITTTHPDGSANIDIAITPSPWFRKMCLDPENAHLSEPALIGDF